MSDIKIFVSHRIDKDSETIDNPLFYPVRCGAVFDEREDKPDIPGDDTGDNISAKRLSYCELTVQYWAWKNVDADYYGLCHYRRYLSFSNKVYEENDLGCIEEPFINDKALEKYNIDAEYMQEVIKRYDIVATKSNDIRKIEGVKSVKDFWGKYPNSYHSEDLQECRKVVKELYPDYAIDFYKHLESKDCRWYNCYIMKKETFNHYCEWLFSILFELEKRIDISSYNLEATRVFGVLSERLFGAYLLHMRRMGYLKILEKQLIFFQNTNKVVFPKPSFDAKNIPIVFSSSDYFVPYLGVAIQSIIDTSNPSDNYDIGILHTTISEDNQKMLLKLIENKDNFNIRFFNCVKFVYNKKFAIPVSISYVKEETFFRLIVQEIFSSYEKIIYLDSDVIVKHDLADLYAIDMGDNLVAAVVEPVVAAYYVSDIEDMKNYLDNKLKLTKPMDYFQGGVIVFNITQMNDSLKKDYLVNLASGSVFKYTDQDILNMCCHGRVYYLDMRWNVCTLDSRSGPVELSPNNIRTKYFDSRKDPYILHYGGTPKPWEKPEVDFGVDFWTTARGSIFYELLLFRHCHNITSWHLTNMHLERVPALEAMMNHIRDLNNKVVGLAPAIENLNQAVTKTIYPAINDVNQRLNSSFIKRALKKLFSWIKKPRGGDR
jgi:lipopolysaccharide biosynthesis glycosyltransferase